MMILPFAQPLGATGGPGADGVHWGTLPRVPFSSVLSGSKITVPARVLRGDVSSGAITYTDITASALSGAANDVPTFNTTDSVSDELQITVPDGVSIGAILFEITTAGVGTGTWLPLVDYDDGTQDVSIVLAASPPDFKSLGVARVAFASALGASVISQSKILNVRERRLRFRMSGVTAVTTAPLAGQIWLELSAVSYADRTTLVAANPSPLPSFASVGQQVPSVGDLDWYLLGSRFAKIFVTLLGARNASHGMEWVYWNGSSVTALPAVNIVDPTGRLATMPTSAYTSRDLRSTYTGLTWGSSGAFGDTGIAGDGYIEARATSPTTAAGFLGLSLLDDGGVNYTGIDYAWHFGHGAQALCSIWSNGVQQAGLTFSLAVADVLRVERKGNDIFFYQNGVLRHSLSGIPAGTYKLDIALIASSGLDQIELVDMSRGYPVWVPFDWAAAPTAATATARAIQAPTAAERTIVVQLPSDAAQLTVSGQTGHALGLRTTSAPGVVHPAHAVARALALSGSGVSGVPVNVAMTFTRCTFVCRGPSPSAARFIVVNVDSGEAVTCNVPANGRIQSTVSSLAFAAGQRVAVMQTQGDGSVEASDGAFILE